jgi:hypothetical protein
MKRTMIAVIAGLLVFGGTFAFAATLGGVNVKNVGASTEVVASCDQDGVDAAFGTPTWDATDQQYEVSSVTISGIDANCSGQNVDVALSDDSGTLLDEENATVGGTSQALTLATPVSAEAVSKIAVVIAE